MSALRSLLFNRLSGQMTIVVLTSLAVIHAAILAGFLLSHRDGLAPPGEGPHQFVPLLRLVAAATPVERTGLIAAINRSTPALELTPLAAAPDASGADENDPRLRGIALRLGDGFQVTAVHEDARPDGRGERLAVRMPDGTALSLRAPPPPAPPPMLGGPVTMTVLFVVVSVTLLGIWIAWALRTPLSAFAEAAETFSLDRDTAALPERGPDEIRAVARALNRMHDRIRALVDDRTRLLAAMGHDLRTPITRLRLRSEFITDEDLRRQMLRDLDQMKAMTEDVLSFLRDGHARESQTAVDLVSVLQTVCDQFSDMGYTVDYEGPAHLTVTARPDDLQRAVANLVDNAVRYGARVSIRLAAAADGVTIDVEDDGPGIPQARKTAMLEAFVRGEDARTMDDRSGFGLGLSIARAIAEAHGGTLTLIDRAPHGLIARITLPVAVPSAALAAH